MYVQDIFIWNYFIQCFIGSKRGGADVPLFETIETNAGTQPKNELQKLAWYGSCFYDDY